MTTTVRSWRGVASEENKEPERCRRWILAQDVQDCHGSLVIPQIWLSVRDRWIFRPAIKNILKKIGSI